MIDLKTKDLYTTNLPSMEVGKDHEGRIWVRFQTEEGVYLTAGASTSCYDELVNKRMTLGAFFAEPESGYAYVIRFRDEDRLGAHLESLDAKTSRERILSYVGEYASHYLN